MLCFGYKRLLFESFANPLLCGKLLKLFTMRFTNWLQAKYSVSVSILYDKNTWDCIESKNLPPLAFIKEYTKEGVACE